MLDEIKKRVDSKVAGWALAISAVALSALAFPSIAGKAESLRDHAEWQQQAVQFSEFTALTGLHTLATVTNSYARDLVSNADLQSIGRVDVKAAQSHAQAYRCLSEAVYYEARSEVRDGQRAVAEVILNRMKSKHYPNSICGVVYQGAHRKSGCQFTFSCDGATDRHPVGKAWQRAQDVAKLVLTDGNPRLLGRETHYHTDNINPVWTGDLHYTMSVGSHKFYRFPWRERPVSVASLSVAPPSP